MTTIPQGHVIVPTKLAALAAGVPEATIRKWASRGKLTRYGRPGRAEYDLDELYELAAAQQRADPGPARARVPGSETATRLGEVMPAEDIISALDSFYCANVVTALWADAVCNRLSGPAIFLLGSEEMEELADSARSAGKKLADRIGDLGGAVTADPRDLMGRLPKGMDFILPDCSNPLAISSVGLGQVTLLTDAYQQFLDQVRGSDDISFHLVLKLLAAEVHRKAGIEAVLDSGS